MSEPTREYRFITAITPEEIKALGNIKRGDSAWASESSIWLDPLSRDYNDAWKPESGPVRRPIDPDPSMPDGKKRWEIVPPNAIETKKMEYFCNGKWKRNRLIRGREVGYYVVCDILAFRRPIALKEAGAGSLEAIRQERSESEQAFIVRLCEHLSERSIDTSDWDGEDDPAKIIANRFADELTQLRTLAKDQGEALEKMEELARRSGHSRECESLFNGDSPCDCGFVELQSKTLTLISKLKGEVGE